MPFSFTERGHSARFGLVVLLFVFALAAVGFAGLAVADGEPSAAEDVSIEHDESSAGARGTGVDPLLVAEKLTIAPADDGNITFAGDTDRSFEITNSTGATVRVEPEDDQSLVEAESIEFDIYRGDGELRSQPVVSTDDSGDVDVSVDGQTEMFTDDVSDSSEEASAPFDSYNVSILDDQDEVLDSTEPRKIAIGYNVGEGIEQNSTTGDVKFTIPRAALNDGVDDDWVAQFSIGDDDELEPVEVDNSGDYFEIVANVDDIDSAEYVYRLELFDSDELPEFSGFDDRVINIFDFGELGENETVSEAAEIEVDNADDLRAAVAGEEVDNSIIESGGTIVVTDDIILDDSGVQVTVPGVTIESDTADARHNVTYDPTDPTSEKTIRINADDVTVQHLNIGRFAPDDREDDDGFSHGIVIRDTDGDEISGVTIDNVDLIGNFEDPNNRGLQVLDGGPGDTPANATDITISNTFVFGFDGGISAAAAYGGHIDDVTVRDNEISSGSTAGFDVSTAGLDGTPAGTIGDVTVVDNDFIKFEEGTAYPVLEKAANDSGQIDVLDFEAIFEHNEFVNGAAIAYDSETESVQSFTESEDADFQFGAITYDIQPSVDIADGAPADTVDVAPRSYFESVEITDELTLQAVGGLEETTLTHDAEDTSSAVDIRSDNVTLDGFFIERVNGTEYSQGVAVRNSSVDITNNYFQERDGPETATTQGILVDDTGGQTADVSIYNNNVSQFGEGIALSTQDESGLDNISVHANTLFDLDIALKLSDFSDTGETINATVTENDLWNNDYGVFVFGDDEAADLGGSDVDGTLELDDVRVTTNNLGGNEQAGIINNGTGDDLNATNNWWGDANGPSGEGPGAGDSVGDNVSFEPFLTEFFDGEAISQLAFEFESADIDIEDPVSPGDPVTVSADITNTANESVTQFVILEREVNGNVTDQDFVETTIDPDSTESVTLVDRPRVTLENEQLNYTVTAPGANETAGNVTLAESSQFEITEQNLSAYDNGNDVVQRDSFPVEATINNTGGVTDTDTVRLTVDGSTVGEKAVELDPDAEETITLIGETDDLSAGEDLSSAVRTSDETNRTGGFDLDAPAEFSPTVTSVTEPVAGENLSVEATIENSGDVKDSTDVELFAPGIGNTTVTTDSIDDGSESVTLNLSTDDDQIGEQSLFVRTPDETVSNETTVLAPAEVDVDIASATDPLVAGQDNVTADIDLSNLGDVSANDVDLELEFDDNTESTELTVDGNDAENVTFDGLEVDEEIAGDEEITVTATYDGTTAEASETVSVREAPDEALFRITDLEIDDDTPTDDVLRGADGTLGVNASVENIGDLEDTQDVSFVVDGETLDETELTLDSDENTTVNFTVDPDDRTSGDRLFGIESADSDRTTTETIRDATPATFDVEVDAPSTLTPGETVGATITNVGDLEPDDTQTVNTSMTADGEVINTTSEQLSLTHNEEATVEVTVPDDVTRAGEFTIGTDVFTEDDSDTAVSDGNFGSIEDALDASGEGDTVQVASGEYDEAVTIDNEGLTLAGEDSTFTNSGTAVTVEADDVTVQGFDFRNADIGLDISADANETTLRTSRFFGSVTNGTEVDADDVAIRNNRFDSLEYAIVLSEHADGAAIENNNILDSTERGLYADSVTHDVTDNNIERNHVAMEANDLAGDGVEINATNNYWGRSGGPTADEIRSPIQVEPFDEDPNEEPDYQITDSNIDKIDSLTAGEETEITWEVTNKGGTAGSDIDDRLEVELDGDRLNRTDAFELGVDGVLPEDDTANFSALSVEVSDSTAQSTDAANLELTTGDDRESRSVDVLTAPAFEASIDSSPDELDTDETLSVDATVENDGQADGTATVELTLDGTPVGTESVSVGGEDDSEVTVSTSLSKSDIGSNIPIDLLPSDGQTGSVTVVEAEPTDDDDDTTTTTTGGPTPTDDDEVVDVDSEIEEELGDDADVTNKETADIETDLDAGTSSATFDATSNIESITFSDTADGETTTRNVDGVPEQTGTPPGAAVSLTQITVPEDVRDTAATLSLRVSSDQLNDLDASADDLVAYRHADGEWQTLETEVVSESDNEIMIEAETPGFSYFAVSTAEEEEEPADDDEPVEDPDDGIGTTGLIGLVVVIALVIAAAVGYRQLNDDGGDNQL